MTKFVATRHFRGTAPPAWVAPVANADSVSGGIVNQAMVIHAATLLANDTVDSRGTLAIQSVQNPTGCTIALNVSAQTITVTPVQVTPVFFSYTVIDTNAFTASATVTLPSVTTASPGGGLPQKVIGPPQLTNPTTLLITAPGTYTLNSGTDYRVQFASTPIPGRVWLVGGNKVHVGWGPTVSDYGGEITESGDGVSCLIVQDMQSECWIEGMVCRKNTTHGHCFQIRCIATAFPVWILNCFADQPLPVNTGGGGSALSVHDGVCPKITVDGFTMVTYGTGISSGGGTYSNLSCNRVYGHWGSNAARLIGDLYEVPATASFTDCWAVDDTNPTAAIDSLVGGVTVTSPPPPLPSTGLLGLRGTQAQHDEGWDTFAETAMASYGINPTFIRFNFLRPKTEDKDTNGNWTGVYHFDNWINTGNPGAARAALDYMQAHNQRHLMTLFYGADLWDGDFTGFANWTIAAMTWHELNYPGSLHTVLVWNEPDGGWPVSMTDYIIMARTIHDAIRAHPEFDHIKISGPVITAPESLYLRNAITNGLLNYIDQLDFHIYDTSEHTILRLQPLQAAMAGNPKPLSVSEWGFFGDVTYETGHQLSVFKSIGVVAASYYISLSFTGNGEGLLEATRPAGQQLTANGQRYIEWHTNIGDAATALGRDTSISLAYCYGFDVGGVKKRHGWSYPPVRLLADGQVVYLDQPGKYFAATSVVVDPAWTRTFRGETRGQFSTVQGTNGWFYMDRNSDNSGEAQMVYNTTFDQWEGVTGGARLIRRGKFVPALKKPFMRRTVSNTEKLLVHGYLYKPSGAGNGIDARITLNGVTKYSVHLQQGVQLVHTAFAVTAGNNLDFEIDSGGEGTGDDTFFVVSIWGVQSTYIVDMVEDNDVPWEYLTRLNNDTALATCSLTSYDDYYYFAPNDQSARIYEDGRVTPGLNQKMIHRWTAPQGYTATISGSVKRLASGAYGTNIRILHNSTVIFSKLPLQFADGVVSFSVVRTVLTNDIIEFEVSSGGTSAVNDAILWQDVRIRG